MKIELNKKIADRLQKRVDESDEFKNIEAYVNYILEQVVAKLDSTKDEKHSEEDEEKVKERLRSLGYLD